VVGNIFPKESIMEKRTTPNNNMNANSNSSDKKSVSHKVGDGIERAGQKISNAGAEKLGNAVYKAGNKVEHMNDKKTSR
jgi:hypothetical protein